MSGVMRFNMFPSGQPNPCANGLYVRHEDYAELEADYLRIISAQDDKWRTQHARDSAELRNLCAARDQYRELSIKYGDKLGEVLKERDAALAECERLRAELEKAKATGIRVAGNLLNDIADLSPKP